MNHKILIVEDERNVSSFIRKGFEEQGFSVMVAYDGICGWYAAKAHKFDLIIVDLMLPELNGIELCKRIRKKYDYEVPVIMLTALGTTDDVINGLEAGADDYITKPFHFKELYARSLSAIRRHKSLEPEKVYTIADLELNDETKTITRAGNKIQLTAKEYHLLMLFMQNKKKVLSREQILEKVWDVEFDMGTNTVDVYINYLRNKIDKNYSPKLIHTVIGMGYVMKDEE